MKRLVILVTASITFLGGCGGNGGYSEEFKAQFLSSCEASSGGQSAYCQCALEHLEANGPEDEEDITVTDQTAAITACAGEVTD